MPCSSGVCSHFADDRPLHSPSFQLSISSCYSIPFRLLLFSGFIHSLFRSSGWLASHSFSSLFRLVDVRIYTLFWFRPYTRSLRFCQFNLIHLSFKIPIIWFLYCAEYRRLEILKSEAFCERNATYKTRENHDCITTTPLNNFTWIYRTL